MQKTEYKIISSNTLEGIEKLTQALLDDGWQPAGPVTFVPEKSYSGYFIHEMVKFLPPDPESFANQEPSFIDRFTQKLNQMDPEVKELLEINDIRLGCDLNGGLVTVVNGKATQGISPNEVLMALKASKHCPMDLDEEAVLNAVEGLL